MIIEGIKLMFIGMTTVMLFLTLMIYLIGLVSRLTRGAAARELDAIKLERELLARTRREKQAKQDTAVNADADEEIAAIAAAVAAYEAEKFAMI
ncbi:OadG family protein [Desulfopila aestuarii]|uniref:Sodium pump decarboxylases, gamma subunit n=1 Tax=Desulfopila aestuarii DSM 18488 TaxID=1121416 RepID=A0A1M7XVY6_9BACT|nr:OadG family transporter subunit [Desulfopila aestuarii]SHO42863.1 sodium pump decarboxylases, gamma subunit [Desulfopila aestuarii DSM 18488]